MISTPVSRKINFSTGYLKPNDNKIVRRLNNMLGMYQDIKKTEDIIKKKNPVLYEVYEGIVPGNAGEIMQCMSIIYPGKIGKEYYMTKGHFHVVEDTAEIYLCLKGKGLLMMETKDGETSWLTMSPGTVAYVPPYWAHRTINVGKSKFVMFCAYPANAGHNYGDIEKTGFSKIVVERNGRPVVIDNPMKSKK